MKILQNGNKEEARQLAVKEMLGHFLDFSEEELEKLGIEETRESKDDIVYFAAKDENILREIHFRKAESKNDEFVTRNYVPPQFHARYMAVSRVCTRRRQENKDLKTQMRFGHRDVELFVKLKSEKDGYKQIKLRDFMEKEELPAFDYTVKWRKQTEKLQRRTLHYTRKDETLPSRKGTEPATGKERVKAPAITRQFSTQDDQEVKRPRKEQQMDTESDNEDNEDAAFSTPARQQQISDEEI